MPSKPKIDQVTDPAEAPHAMVDDKGQLFFPDDAAGARLLNVEHGATPLRPERWPWPDWQGTPDVARGNVATGPLDLEEIPLPPCADECFPNGLPVGWREACCIHGTHTP